MSDDQPAKPAQTAYREEPNYQGHLELVLEANTVIVRNEPFYATVRQRLEERTILVGHENPSL